MTLVPREIKRFARNGACVWRGGRVPPMHGPREAPRNPPAAS
jgi:hypothetical protein